MSPPPPAGKGTALGRIGDALRRRLRAPVRGAPPATVPGLGSGEEAAVAAAAREKPGGADADVAPPAPALEPPVPDPGPGPEPTPEPGARIDAARERLRAKIEPPAEADPDAP